MDLDLDVSAPSTSGSGIVWDARHIVTNYHVISGFKTKAQVTLLEDTGGRLTIPAVILGFDAARDIAVLRAEDGRELPGAVKLGSSDGLRVGRSVFAIGNPFGLDQTLTSGVVSGVGRRVLTGSNSLGRPKLLFNMIQTDAAINPGNSGGPLLDSSGSLIGMNTAILSTSGSFAGIGFAVPVDMLKVIVAMIIRDGKVKTIDAGIEYSSGLQARLFGIKQGLLVLRIRKGSPADFAGIRGLAEQSGFGAAPLVGDVISHINGQRVDSEADYLQAMDQSVSAEGGVIEMTVLRNLLPVSNNGMENNRDKTTTLNLKEIKLKLKL